MLRIDLTTWDAYKWPEWVPEKIRQEIERFWDTKGGRSPFQWMENAAQNRAPAFGSNASLRRMRKDVLVAFEDGHFEHCTGRYVHCWNNIGRLVHGDGSFSYVALGHSEDKIEQHAKVD